jgi:hypothetical protein
VKISKKHAIGLFHFFAGFTSDFLTGAAAGFSAGFLSVGFFAAGGAGAVAAKLKCVLS